jgi:hypothetical protein
VRFRPKGTRTRLKTRHRMGTAAGGILFRVGDGFDVEFAVARAIEFAKEDALPVAQNELAVGYKNGLLGTHEDGFHVRVGIAFGVFVGPAFRDEVIEDAFDIAGDVWVGVLVDGDCGGGVRDVPMADPMVCCGFCDCGLYLV